MLISPILEAEPDFDAESQSPESSENVIVLSTRVRLARNLNDHSFPGWSKPEQRKEVLEKCCLAIQKLSQMQGASTFYLEDLSPLERKILVERHLISRELAEADKTQGAGVVISKNQRCSIMINEEDHLRIQYISQGLEIENTWRVIDSIDNALEELVDYAFSEEYGYLTSCPTNVGTGMRASAMMHLPALVLDGHMDRVIRAVNQAGIAVRGLFGEGSEASGSIFQISNQQTLGVSEQEILQNLNKFLETIIQRERDVRQKLVEDEPAKLRDKIGRAYGIFKYAHFLSSNEAMNLLSLLRLAIDLGFILSSESLQKRMNQLLIESQPGHVQYAIKQHPPNSSKDHYRANYFRKQFEDLPCPNFDKLSL